MFNRQEFLTWFQESGGWYNKDLVDLVPFPGMGYGAIAMNDIPEDEPLFHIPDDLILSPFSSDLKNRLSRMEWNHLAHGWAQLILVMMWETIKGPKSRWSAYLANMPQNFDTPMFWSEDEKTGLSGTDIELRIGKEEAELEYKNTVLPIIQAHTELFPIDSPHTTIEAFHIQGSRILSRSFTVPTSHFGSKSSNEGSDDEEDDVAVMIPFADMLNAACGKDNAHLFMDELSPQHSAKGVSMRTTKIVEKSKQIFNTYDSPPNSELLRKYGHVDVLPLPSPLLALLEPSEIDIWPYGNPADEVLLPGDLIVNCVAKELDDKADESWEGDVQERIDWWLEEGQDDVFPLSLSPSLDTNLISFIRLLLYDNEWQKAKKKGKFPRSAVDDTVASILIRAVQQRLGQYKNNIRDNLNSLQTFLAMSSQENSLKEPWELPQTRAFCATVVKLGEQRSLHLAARTIPQAKNTNDDSKKRKIQSSLTRGMNKRLS
ncbi:hypothetical protein L204_101121 [Cryptococcus depauperatus]|nr:hypothetical protein L204_00948 [Cryptococcus depauperatus CBS 7855]